MNIQAKLGTTCLIAILLLGSVGFMGRQITALTIIQILAAVFLFLLNIRVAALVIYVSAFVFGFLAEYIAVNKDIWTYSHSSVDGLPLWVPFVWGTVTLILTNSYQFVSVLTENKKDQHVDINNTKGNQKN